MAETKLVEAVHHDVYPSVSPFGDLKGAADGRNVLVTGAGTGVGKAIARAFAQAGAQTVVLTGRRTGVLENVKKEIEAESSSCKVIVESLDVSVNEAVEGIFSKLGSTGVEIDVLINNAGVNMSHQKIRDSNPDHWWTNYEIMLKGPYLMTRAWLRARKSTKPGAVIMTSSIGAYTRVPEHSSYASVKAALNRITEWVAVEGKEQNVQAIAFHPGGVPDTDITSKSPEFMQKYYIDTPELGGGVAVYLSTARAGWLSGRYFDARWDVEELEKHKDRIVEDDLLQMSLLGDARIRID